MLVAVLILSGIFIDIQANYENETALHTIHKRNERRLKSEDSYSVCSGKTVKQCERIKSKELKQCKICGLVNNDGVEPEIIGGKDVDPPYLYPWMVALIKDERTSCGGAIVNESYILTAAHCISEYDEATSKFKRYLRPNELKIGFLTKTHDVEQKKVGKILPHPKFKPHQMTYDVALLKLSEKITCDTYKHPICLPPADFNSDNQENTTFYVTGWGATSLNFKKQPKKLQQAQAKMVSFDKCSSRLNTSRVEDTSYCLMGTENGTPCFGDSGGSLFFLHKKKYATVGVASLHTCKMCSADKPFVYTSIPKTLSWIKKVIGSK